MKNPESLINNDNEKTTANLLAFKIIERLKSCEPESVREIFNKACVEKLDINKKIIADFLKEDIRLWLSIGRFEKVKKDISFNREYKIGIDENKIVKMLIETIQIKLVDDNLRHSVITILNIINELEFPFSMSDKENLLKAINELYIKKFKEENFDESNKILFIKNLIHALF